jgi:hypothetical protein
VRALAYAAGQVKGPLSGPAVLAQLNKMTTYNPGLSPVVSYTTVPAATAPGPRVFSVYGVRLTISGGQLTLPPGNPWFNVFTGEPYAGPAVAGPDTLAATK